jgi:hypothetical protein
VIVAVAVIALLLLATQLVHAQTAPSCPGDKLVWVNTRSHIYHFEGERYFGHTKYGRFECEHQADMEGDRPTRNGQ